jgi:phage shock protein PspC (stress-responsive transcriptional regulator)
MNKRLTKGLDRKLFGVCSGIADYFETDPTLIRIVFVLAFFGFGIGPLAYLILALIMPD